MRRNLTSILPSVVLLAYLGTAGPAADIVSHPNILLITAGEWRFKTNGVRCAAGYKPCCTMHPASGTRGCSGKTLQQTQKWGHDPDGDADRQTAASDERAGTDVRVHGHEAAFQFSPMPAGLRTLRAFARLRV